MTGMVDHLQPSKVYSAAQQHSSHKYRAFHLVMGLPNQKRASIHQHIDSAPRVTFIVQRYVDTMPLNMWMHCTGMQSR